MPADEHGRWLAVRTLALGALVVAGNAVFVALVLWLSGFLLVKGTGFLVGSAAQGGFGWLVHGPVVRAAVRALLWTGSAATDLARSPAVALLTVGFLLAQYGYVRRYPLLPEMEPVETAPAPDLKQRVRSLAMQAGVPAPSVVVAGADRANSFTVGRRGNATVVVTEPLVERLDDDELDAVLAHELAHVRNRDVAVMTMAVVPFRLARWLGVQVDRFLYAAGWSCYLLWAVVVSLLTLGMAGVLVHRAVADAYDAVLGVVPGAEPGALVPGLTAALRALLVPFWGFVGSVYVTVAVTLLLWMALAVVPLVALGTYYVVLGVTPRSLSRAREHAADLGAATISGDPAALASALETLDGGDPRPERDYRETGAIESLCLRPGGLAVERNVGPVRAWVAEEKPWLDRLLSALPSRFVAHPDTAERVDRLRALAADADTDGQH